MKEKGRRRGDGRERGRERENVVHLLSHTSNAVTDRKRPS